MCDDGSSVVSPTTTDEANGEASLVDSPNLIVDPSELTPEEIALLNSTPETGEAGEASPEVLSQTDIDSLRSESLNSLYFFAKAILGYADFVPHIHGQICKLLEDETNKHLVVVLPRSWFKSTLVSIAYPIWRAVRNPNVRILIAQNTASNATKKLAEIRWHFEQNSIFRAIFPDRLPTKDQRWTTECLELPRELSSPEGTIEGVGIQTQIVSRHYDIIIEDDTVAPDLDELGIDNLSPTKENIDQAIGWHKLSTPLFVHPEHHQNIIVGTRWFEKDLISWVRENDFDFKFYTRAVRELNGEPSEFGSPAWPERFGESVLESLQHKLGHYMFSCLYMNLPINSNTQSFQLEWFKYYDTPPENLLIYTTVDPASDATKVKGEPDDTVVCTTGKHMTTGRIYVLRIDYLRGNPGEVIDLIFSHVQQFHPLKVGIESVAYQNTLEYWVREKMKERKEWFSVEPLSTGNRTKSSRILGLTPVVESGMLLFGRGMSKLVSQLVSFPFGSHDDGPDALAMQQNFWPLTQSVRERQQAVQFDPMSYGAAMTEILQRHKVKESKMSVFDVFKTTTPATNPWPWEHRRQEPVAGT